MNRSRSIFACLCSILLLAFGQGHAQSVFWSDGFDVNPAGHWIAFSAWHVGSPTIGPPVNGSGYRTHSGANCASTENYSYNQDGRIYCRSYLSGSNSLVIPAASASPTLTFWQWYHFANALGFVELKTGTNGWQPISSTYLNVTSGGEWVQSSIDLSAYAGKSVQIAFHFTSGGCCGNALGWYVDDVSLTVVPPPPMLTVPPNQVISFGQTLTVTNYATNSASPGSTFTFALASSSANARINTNGVLNWTNTAAPPGTYVLYVKVTDNTLLLAATNNFSVTVLPPPPLLVAVSQASNHSFKFSFQTASNFTWRIQATTNLNVPATNWLTIFTNKAGVSGTLQFTDRLATNFLRRFYRAVYP